MPFSSPTTTSAVNEKRRPPLTTLATRLISTTRSWRSRPVLEMDRSGAGIERVRLEDQAALAGALGERTHAPVVAVSASIEDRGLDAGGLGALREQLARALCLLHPGQRLEVVLGPVDGGQRAARRVVDELREDAAVGAEHGDPGPLGRAGDLRADAAAALEPLGGAGGDGHARLLRVVVCAPAARSSRLRVMRACLPSGRRTRPRSGSPCPCRARAAAACGSPRRPRRPAAWSCP